MSNLCRHCHRELVDGACPDPIRVTNSPSPDQASAPVAETEPNNGLAWSRIIRYIDDQFGRGNISRDVGRSLRERLCDLTDEHAAALAAERTRVAGLVAERDAMRRELRQWAIGVDYDSAPPRDVMCLVCRLEWTMDEPEEHEADCLAALTAAAE